MDCYLCKKPISEEQAYAVVPFVGSAHNRCLEIYNTHKRRLRSLELSSLSTHEISSLKELILELEN
jgi:hypothetical protein